VSGLPYAGWTLREICDAAERVDSAAWYRMSLPVAVAINMRQKSKAKQIPYDAFSPYRESKSLGGNKIKLDASSISMLKMFLPENERGKK